MKNKTNEWRNAVYLTTVQDSITALIYESKLNAEGIPVEKRYKGAGNFLEIALGSNVTFPIELFVPEETLEDAKNIIVPIPIDDDFDVTAFDNAGGETRLAVIGDPIAHSLSPLMHTDIIKRHGIEASYKPILVTPDDLESFVWGGDALALNGFNVTMPHKQKIMKLIDKVDDEALLYGAVNTVKNADGTLVGYNTDAGGFLMALDRHGVSMDGANVLLLGAGGVAGTLLSACLNAGAHEITILNRTASKATELCAHRARCVPDEMTDVTLKKYTPKADIIVNCTSLGMSGTDGAFADFSFLDGAHAFLMDLIYNPTETSLLKNGRERGLKTLNGLDMLIGQGLLSFEIFTGIKVDYEEEYRVLYELLNRVVETQNVENK